MKKHISKRVISAILAFVMVFLMIPVTMFSAFAVEDSAEAVDESSSKITVTDHDILSSYNALSGLDISEIGLGGGKKPASYIFNSGKLNDGEGGLYSSSIAVFQEGFDYYASVRSGSTMAEFISSQSVTDSLTVSASVGVAKIAKISAESKFTTEEQSSYREAVETYFYEYNTVVKKGTYSFRESALSLVRNAPEEYLDADFYKDLTDRSMSPADFFAEYGTHIITAYTAGGTAGVFASSIKTESNTSTSLKTTYENEVKVEATVNGISASVGVANSSVTSVTNSLNKMGISSYAGFYAKGGATSIDFNGTEAVHASWVESVSRANSRVLPDENLKLVPIWALIPIVGNEARILELTEYFLDMSEKQDIEFYEKYGVKDIEFDYSDDWVNFADAKIITNEAELNDIRNDLNGVYVLANNIVLSDYANWTPIGTKEEPFTGRIYGNYNTISSLNITASIEDDPMNSTLVGLIGCNDGMVTDLRISGNISVPDFARDNVYIGAIAAYNQGIVNNCYDEVYYDIEPSSMSYANFPIDETDVESNKTYYIGDSLGIHLKGQEGTTYSNTNIVVQESNNVGPVLIILENVNMTGNAGEGTIYNPTTRPVYIISIGTSNSIKGKDGNPGTMAINSRTANVSIVGSADLAIFGGNGTNGGTGATGYGSRAGRGGDGHSGNYAIESASVFISTDDESNVEIRGGNGGRGGDGGYGAKVDNDPGFGGFGAHGHKGSMAINTTEIVCRSGNVIINGGNGGNGGSGGYGEEDYKYINEPGYGGDGGYGGAGSVAIPNTCSVNAENATLIINSGFGGQGGAGGFGEGTGYAPDGYNGSTPSPKTQVYANSKRYVLHEDTKYWDDAKAHAESSGGYLATITSAEEYAVVKELLKYRTGSNYYLGGKRSDEDRNVWTWITGETFDFAVWNEGEPNDTYGSEGVLGFQISSENDGFNDFPGNIGYGYIIEYDLTSDVVDTDGCLTGLTVGYNSETGKNKKFSRAEWNEEKIEINAVGDIEYFSDEQFDNTDFNISLGDQELVLYGKSYDFSFLDTDVFEKITYVEVSKDEYTRKIPVKAIKVVPDEIIIVEGTVKTEYAFNDQDHVEPFEIIGIIVRVNYNNGSYRYVGEEDITYVAPILEYVGQKKDVVVTYKDAGKSVTATYSISAVEDPLLEMHIQKKPTKLSYKQGDTISIEGLSVKEVRKSGAYDLDNKDLIIEYPSMCEVGTQTVKVWHPAGGIYCTFDITISALDGYEHPWDAGKITAEATHLSSGTRTYTCTDCGEVRTEMIPAITTHFYGEWEKVDANQHKRTCECGDTVVADHAWNFVEEIVAPTHVARGEELYACNDCDATKIEYTEILPDHEFAKWYEYDNMQHSRVCACGLAEFAPHAWDDGVVTLEPTYDSAGNKTYTCNDCGATKYEELPRIEISDTTPVLTIDSKNGVIGNIATVKIAIANNPGITSMKINVAYDSALLTLYDVEYNSAMGGQSVLPEKMTTLNGNVILYWTDGFVDYSQDGVFATLTFIVNEDAVPGATTTISASYDPEDVYNADETNVTFYCEDGVITFTDYTPGDINGDGVVNTKDTTRLMRYLAGWEVEVNEAALDVNGDGSVNTKDTTRLMRYLAGWDVEVY